MEVLAVGVLGLSQVQHVIIRFLGWVAVTISTVINIYIIIAIMFIAIS